jgi:hypothetical protein
MSTRRFVKDLIHGSRLRGSRERHWWPYGRLTPSGRLAFAGHRERFLLMDLHLLHLLSPQASLWIDSDGRQVLP